MFSNLPEFSQKFILETMLNPSLAKTMSTRGDIASKGASPKVVSTEALALVLTM